MTFKLATITFCKSMLLVLVCMVGFSSSTNAYADEVDVSGYFRNIKKFDEEIFFPKDIRIEDQEGNIIDVYDTEGGRYTVLNLWATWCSSCVKELPSLSRLKSSVISKKGWRVLAVSIDIEDHRDKVFEFVKDKDIGDFALHFDRELTLQKNMNVRGLPVTWILDDEGRILYEILGIAEWDRLGIISFLLGIRS